MSVLTPQVAPAVATPPPELETKALTWKERAQALEITDQASHDRAAEMLLGIKDLMSEAEKHHRPIIDAAHRAHKAAIAGLNRILDPLKAAEAVLKPRIAAFVREQQRLAEEARRKAEEEERRRLQEEQLAAAIEAENQGAAEEEVAAILAEPVVAPRVAPPPAFTPAKGVAVRTTWKGECTNLMALVKAVAEGKAPVALLQVNQSALDQMARALKSTFSVPGCRAVVSSSVAAGRR